MVEPHWNSILAATSKPECPFLMLTKFVRAAFGLGYGRLRGRPSYPELCFNGLSHHQIIVSLQVPLVESSVSQHVSLSLGCSLFSLVLFLIILTCFATLSSQFCYAVLQTPLPRSLSVGQIASAWWLLNCGNSVADRAEVSMCGEHMSLL